MVTSSLALSEYFPPFWPLFKVFLGLLTGLLVASFLEALNLTKPIAKLTKPLVRCAHLNDVAATSFALALFSPASANALLGQNIKEHHITEKEATIANLLNSLPASMVHFPTVFFFAFPIIGFTALGYVGLSFLAAILRSIVTIFLGRCLLPKQQIQDNNAPNHTEANTPTKNTNILSDALKKASARFLKRAPRLLYISIPIYCIIYYLQQFGYFEKAELWLGNYVSFDFLNVESYSVIMLYMAAEMRAAIVAGASLLNTNGISATEMVLALLIGNILSTPMRALRHQLPAYAAYFQTKFAIKLVIIGQLLRMLSMLVVTVGFYWIMI